MFPVYFRVVLIKPVQANDYIFLSYVCHHKHHLLSVVSDYHVQYGNFTNCPIVVLCTVDCYDWLSSKIREAYEDEQGH